MRQSMLGISPSGWPPGQSPAQAFLSSPAMESPGQIGHSHPRPESPCYDQQSTFYEVVKILQNLVSVGLDQRQISYLCKPANFNQLGTLANTDADVTQRAWDLVYQRLPGSKPRKLSRGSSIRFPSGVSSLRSNRSNRSHWSASTDLSTSTAESYTSGSGISFKGQHQAPAWDTAPGEIDATISSDPAILVNDTTMAFNATNFEQPQWQDFNQAANPSGSVSVYRPHPLVDVSGISGVANVSYAAPNFASSYKYLAGGYTSQDNRPSVGDTDSTHQSSREGILGKDQIKYPCPEPGCKRWYVRSVELAKHLQGDHEKNDVFVCQHDQKCDKQTHRHATWARHHSKDHNSCKKGDACVKSTNDGKKRYWGCYMCIHLSRDVSSHADHHQSHFRDGTAQPLKYSTMILSLLSQEATKGKWQAHCLTMNISIGDYDFGWQPAQYKEIRMALEYGKYRGSDISDPFVADWLLNELVALMSGGQTRPECATPHPGSLPNADDSWLDVNPRNRTFFLDTTDAEFTEGF
ncbi:uncharacterized protein PV07_03452 [Cladophialophora immunda]|uniref:C2H2-type domain-containing protein n=1 Tax=Cladophialophora immunda TaxID=569365 RepID=A0A0D2CL06_9EURO|nr:uncharacterized protein PV07_03452 [Cladophialophora immunda]KIW31863.1 hypothetical protein PV07_03452 [Cladophialophora immunda]OQU98419.1 hypothetical protein CLAIMM_04212 [Cladophialophora immunda]